ncbi:DeoR/GlpR family DNA-binding transcription regulator [Fictibacillus phosphorivorans]|uniref:DeoR/GlpR family DNA-binding transcription regulator n=1 Tax=Fictibacillus phosphorivorans TaxID=1221500 RepID=UPI00203C6589|nr:DeoR/GlpR family DNA-binding transcription regulator [Fictibacillus phosphorivorans]MCM3717749.1 DeoR/GlpR family DNA-binding transcription regulator [Fictibacillus phosphorivorans]MCM3775649.1 DeoR/GlpR family DNA-binding transcription regulator [Fictibacillus phosphorivorans]
MAKVFAPERRKLIMDKLYQNQRVTVKELSEEIKVSEATLRTDLTKMEEDGLLKRTHGGAILIDIIDSETNFSSREKRNKDEKCAIAKKAVELVSNGQCIMLDASSTALELARTLKDMPIRLTVVTSGINTALELNEHPDITVILLGGIVKRGSYSLEGSLGINILKQINIDLMFTSANGFSLESGLTDFSVYEVELKKAMVNASHKVIALLDHTKINKNSIASFASIDQIDTIITDFKITDDYAKKLEEQNIDVLVVSTDENGHNPS